MSKNIFSDKVDYVNRFLTNQSRYLQFPSCVYQDAKLHASERDHIVVISEMKMPKSEKEGKLDMKYSYCESFLTPENTNELLREQIEAAEREVKERKVKDSSDFQVRKIGANSLREGMQSSHSKYKTLGNLSEETKDQHHNARGAEEDTYEGGSDEEEKEIDTSKMSLQEVARMMARQKRKEEGIKSEESSEEEDMEAEVISGGKAQLLSDDGLGPPMNKHESENVSDVEESKGTKEEVKAQPEDTQKVEAKEPLQEESTDKSKNQPEEDQLQEQPKEEEKNEENSQSEEAKKETEEDKKDEEEHKEEPKDPSEDLRERFEKLPKDLQQEVVNAAFDKGFNEHPNSSKFLYHGYTPTACGPNPAMNGYEAGKIGNERFARSGYSIPDNEKIVYETRQNGYYDYVSYNNELKYNEVSYEPPILREKYQISLWRCDQFTCVKTKDRYFTPKSSKINRKGKHGFQGFEIQFSMDGEHIVLVEKKAKNMEKQLIVILDAYTLEVVDEHMVYYSLDSRERPDVQAEDEEEYEDDMSEYPTLKETPTVFVWGKGRYIMHGQTIDGAVSILQYEIIDTQEDKRFLICRNTLGSSSDRFKDCQIVDIKVSPKNNEVLYMGGYVGASVFTYEVNIRDQKAKLISQINCEERNHSNYSIDQSCQKHYHSRLVENKKGKLVCRIFSFGIDESHTISENPPKETFTEHKASFIAKADKESLVGMEYNKRNEFCVHVSGKVSFTKTIDNMDYCPNISSVSDYCIRGDNSVMIISDFNEQSFEVLYVRDKAGMNPRRYTVKETTFIHFYYPTVVLMKGGTEILSYSVTTGVYHYRKLGAPLIFRSSELTSEYDVKITGFIDLGDYLAFADYSLSTHYMSTSSTISKAYIEKANFPDSQLLAGFNVFKYKYGEKEEDSFCLHFKRFLLFSSSASYGVFRVVEARYEPGELHAIIYQGFLTYKKDSKSIEFFTPPLNFEDKNSGVSIYSSDDFIKRMRPCYNKSTGSFNFDIVDEIGYVKRCNLKVEEKKTELVLQNEYFVSKNFSGTNNFLLTDGMVYESDANAYLCVEKGEHTQSHFKITPDIKGIDKYEISEEYPLEHQNWLLFYGPLEEEFFENKTQSRQDEPKPGESSLEESEIYDDELESRVYGALLIPKYNIPSVPICNVGNNDTYKCEYFFYHNNNFVVYHKYSYNFSGHIAICIVKRNGELYQQLKLKIEGCQDHSYAQLYVSPSGRYIMYAEKDKDKDEVVWGRIVELSFDSDNSNFFLRDIYKVNLSDLYGIKPESINMYEYDPKFILSLTDDCTIFYIGKQDGIIQINDQKTDKDLFKGKFGKDPYDDTKDKDLKSYGVTTKPKNGGIIIYTDEKAWFIRYDSKQDKIYPMEEIKIEINKNQMTISYIYDCTDPDLIVIHLISQGGNQHLVLVWDIVHNKELQNFSPKNYCSYITGPKSRAGYLLVDNTYINLDDGLINCYFEHQFNSNFFYGQTGGYRMNKNEEIILCGGHLITKETLVEVVSLESYIQGEDKIDSENVNFEKIRFIVNGNTALHYYALEYDILKSVVDCMEKHRPEYLNAILMKNKRGKSPLDITIDSESPKNTELLLRKLQLFEDSSLSRLFYQRFNDLLAMDITAFHDYLDSCYFQTIQMKNINYLDLKRVHYKKLKRKHDPVIMIPHSSSIMDEVFMDKICDPRKKKEEERKKKEEERKKKEAEDKKEEEKEEKKEGQQHDGEESSEQALISNSLSERNSHEDLILDVPVPKPKTKAEKAKEKERKRRKRIEIKAIEFDWIFNKVEGVAFLRVLSETKTIDLFSLNIVRNIIRFCWGYYWTYIMIYLFMPYLAYLSLFVLYSTYFHKKKIDNEDGAWEGFGIANSLSLVFLILFILYFSYYEIRQMIFHKFAYFKSFWNMVDLVSILLNSVVCYGDIFELDNQDLNVLMGWAVLVMWLKLFYFGRIFERTAALIRMIVEITYGMANFLIIFLIAIAGFGNCFMIMARNYGTEEMFTGQTFWRAFIYSYRQAMGDFDTDAYEDDDKYYLFFIWFLNTMITLIIILNLLIAIMGDAFDKVQDTLENNTLKEFASTMIENEFLLNRARLFSSAKYIIVIQEEKADESGITWEGKLKFLKKIMDRQVSEQKKVVETLEKSIVATFKEKTEKRTKELENSTTKYVSQISEKVDHLFTLFDKSDKQEEE
ncbi:unnamed protein product [Moneuplotes crassus]|uniref:Ion transport domain-containing protein n=1 Tax=Euplotes crassus TaxID=5936 RepID=A0AAD1XBN2_EUPCR|nr:unnamed protein product [Moneuplotes crassus]